MADVVHGIAIVKTLLRLVGGIAVTGRSAVGAGYGAVPARVPVQRVTPGVIGIHHQTMAHLFAQLHLQSVITRGRNRLPLAHGAVVRVQTAYRIVGVDLAAQLAAKVVGDASALRQTPARDAVDVFRPVVVVALRAHVVQLHHCARSNLVLNTQVLVEHARITYAGLQNNARQLGQVRISREPASYVAYRLIAKTLSDVGRRTGKGYRRGAVGAAGGTVDNGLYVATQEVDSIVKGVVRQVPARVGKRVIQRIFIRYAEAAAQGGLAVAKDIVGEADPRAEVLVITFPQRLCGRKATRSANTSQLGRRHSRRCGAVVSLTTNRSRSTRGNVGLLHPALSGGDVVNDVRSRSLDKRGHQIVQFRVPRVQVVTQAQIQGQLAAHLPVILEVSAELNVAPVPDIGIQSGRVIGQNARVYACRLRVR